MTALRSALHAQMPNVADLRALAWADLHPLSAQRERTALIVDRVRLIAGAFAFLTLAWIPVDALGIAWPVWGELALYRVVASLAFAGLAIHSFDSASPKAAYLALAGLLAVPLVFYLPALGLLDRADADSDSLAVVTAYYYLPIIVAAGLGFFPLTALEAVAFGVPILAAMVTVTVIYPDLAGLQSALATIWRLLLITGISALAGISQLRLLLMLTEQATRDGLTGLLTRRVGEEVLEQQFSFAARNDMPLAVLFVDLDRFKQINDRFGHEAGDEVLRVAAAGLRRTLRHQDIVVRWGGEEFLVVLPGADTASVEATVRRIASAGIGRRPDGEPLTASIGIAERRSDAQDQSQAVVALADKRMYAAKSAGRNRYCFQGEPVLWLAAPLDRQPAEDGDRARDAGLVSHVRAQGHGTIVNVTE
jgi:diguanylate cyclase (GGDEF)-like protein